MSMFTVVVYRGKYELNCTISSLEGKFDIWGKKINMIIHNISIFNPE